MESRLMGLDMGLRRIGVALSDPTGNIALPLTVLKRDRDDNVTVGMIERLAKEKQVGKVVVGLPLNMDGTQGEGANKSIAFAELLTERTSLKIELWDERLSTREAENVLLSAMVSRRKRRKVVDKLAAQLILQSYMDRRNT